MRPARSCRVRSSSFLLSAVRFSLSAVKFVLSASSFWLLPDSSSLRAVSSAFAPSSSAIPACKRDASSSRVFCCSLSRVTSALDCCKAASVRSCSDLAASKSACVCKRLFFVSCIVRLSSSKPNSAVRTFSDAAAMTPKVKVVITMPVKIVMMIDVCRGRSPKIDKRFLPIFVPSRSPINAIAPPVMTSTTIKRIPDIYLSTFLPIISVMPAAPDTHRLPCQ